MKHVILVDMRYFGNYLHEMRHSLHMNQQHAAKLLGVDPREYVAYEHGRKCLSESAVRKILYHAFMAMQTKYALGNPVRK